VVRLSAERIMKSTVAARLRLTRQALKLSHIDLRRITRISPQAWNNAETGDNLLGDEAAEVPPTSGTSMRVVSNGIVQNSHHPREKAAYTSPDSEVAPTELSGSIGAERARTSRMVQIQYDPKETAYVARDSESGLIVMRHQDREHLRDVCEWIGWRVV
jgi:hypothetical protein